MRVFMAKPVQSGLRVKPPDPAPLARAPAAWARASRRARERGGGYGPGSGGWAARRARAAAEIGALATATATATAPAARRAALCNLIRGRGRRGRGGVGRSNLCRTSCVGMGSAGLGLARESSSEAPARRGWAAREAESSLQGAAWLFLPLPPPAPRRTPAAVGAARQQELGPGAPAWAGQAGPGVGLCFPLGKASPWLQMLRSRL